jgi:hypothetical protein
MTQFMRTARLATLLLFLVALFTPLIGPARPAQASGAIYVNFQSAGAPVPTSPVLYMRDYGLAYGARTRGDVDNAKSTDPDPAPSGFTFGWVVPGTTNPRNLNATPSQGRDRNIVPDIDQRFDTLMHMQASGREADWLIDLPNGSYDVTVAVGDPQSSSNDSDHSISLNGTLVINRFRPASTEPNGSSTRSRVVTNAVEIVDGRLRVSAQGGTNTKIHFIIITPITDPNQPRVRGVSPSDGQTNVLRDTGITAELFVLGGGLRANTVNPDTVFLRRASDNALIPSSVNTTAGGDAITLQPTDYLEPFTRYIFTITAGVEGNGGLPFRPFSSSFTTGSNGGPDGDNQIAFDMVSNVGEGPQFSSLAIGPDNRLYVASLTGLIYRYTINADGTLSGQQIITTVQQNEGGNRAIIGLVFDPTSTAAEPILWISHSGPFVTEGAPDWTGKIARLWGSNLQNFQNYVENLPHSYKDHMANSLEFGPDGKLYLSVGSNNAMGHPDNAWASRPERLLTAAILRIDQTALAALPSLPLDVKTEDRGANNYNPFAPGAPVTIFASGVRNAYDLVWHTNGQLYAPTNGSAAGGNAPPIPANAASLPQCVRRGYTGPVGQPGNFGIVAQRDFLYRVVQGGYYGHPNPTRCEWILNGGNPTGGVDPEEIASYPVGTLPDPNYRGIAYGFDLHKSPNGAIEYRNAEAFGGALQGWLIVTRYSQGKDLIGLRPGGPNLDIVESRTRLQGVGNSFTGNGPLDITEDVRNGNLYVIQFNTSEQIPSRIALLRPINDPAPRIRATSGPLYFTDPNASDSANSISQLIQIENIGLNPLTITSGGYSFIGPNANEFVVFGQSGGLAAEIPPNGSHFVRVALRATSPGVKSASLRIQSNAANGTIEIPVRGLGLAAGSEPSLQWVLDAYGLNITVGDDFPANSKINNSNPYGVLLGQEISADMFERADNASPVDIQPVAVFGPAANASPVDIQPVAVFGPAAADARVLSFGWYGATAAATPPLNQLFLVNGGSDRNNGQRLAPQLSGATLSFDPGTQRFGFYSNWAFFNDRTVYSEAARNTWETTVSHRQKVRIYPLIEGGNTIDNAYVIAFEETKFEETNMLDATANPDFQDLVVIVRNVRPSTPPTADAGANRTVSVNELVTLEGDGRDNETPVGNLTVSWTQTGGPAVALSNANMLTPSFTAPASPTTLTFQLTVTDPSGLSATDSVTITVVNSSISGLTITRTPPGDLLIGSTATFTVSVTAGSNVTYAWTITDPQGGTTNRSGASFSYTFPTVVGEYNVQVVASSGGTDPINQSVTVRLFNNRPVAQITPSNALIVQVGEAVALSGSTSSDPDGHAISSYAWTNNAGIAFVPNAQADTVNFTAPNSPGEVLVTLVVTDAYGRASNPTTATITVTEAPPPPNNPPTANAGADRNVNAGSAVTLNGSGSDPDGDALSYIWTQTAGPNVVLTGANTAQASFTAPNAAATLSFHLTVSDGQASATDDVTITVLPLSPTNRPPTANAGSDINTSTGSAVTLNGSGSDPDGDELSFSWRQLGGTLVLLNNATTATPNFTAPSVADTLEFELTVSDGELSATDQVRVIVNLPNRPNNPPVARAGDDIRVPVGSTVNLDGSASFDPNGDALSYSWSQLDGGSVALAAANGAINSFTAPTNPAALTFRLTVTDAFGATATSDLLVLVEPANRANNPPVANAGSTLRAPVGAPVTLDASASFDPDRDAISYSWRRVSGPNVSVQSSGAQASFTAPNSPATLVFEVTVTDSFGKSATDQVSVQVVSGLAANEPPIANAGPDRRALANTMVYLDATGSSDPDGDAINFIWRQVSGPQALLSLSDQGVAAVLTPATSGTLVFEVLVTDSFGGNNVDRMTLRVGPAASNDSPVAQASGPTQVQPGESVRLDGMASSDPDGDALRYSWRQVSGPAVVLVGSKTALANFSAPNGPSTLVFELRVTDNFGADNITTVTIEVRPAQAPRFQLFLPSLQR